MASSKTRDLHIYFRSFKRILWFQHNFQIRVLKQLCLSLLACRQKYYGRSWKVKHILYIIICMIRVFCWRRRAAEQRKWNHKRNCKISIQFVTSFSSTYFSCFIFCLFVCIDVGMHNSMRCVYLLRIPHFPPVLKRKIPSASFFCFIPNKKCLFPYSHITLQAIGSYISCNQCNLESHQSHGSTVLSLIQLFISVYRRFLMLCLYFTRVLRTTYITQHGMKYSYKWKI